MYVCMCSMNSYNMCCRVVGARTLFESNWRMSVCPVKELSSMCAAGRETAPSPAMMRTPTPVGGSACAFFYSMMMMMMSYIEDEPSHSKASKKLRAPSNTRDSSTTRSRPASATRGPRYCMYVCNLVSCNDSQRLLGRALWLLIRCGK